MIKLPETAVGGLNRLLGGASRRRQRYNLGENHMACPICSWSPDNPDYLLLHETRYWRVVLAPNQYLVGRCVIHLKRHCGDVADTTPDEIVEWLTIVNTVERALRTAFDATMFNWSCYMNHSYREDPPAPHIHWWAVPRYNHHVTIGNWIFRDPDFGNPYDHYRWLEVPREIHQQIASRIQRAISS
jgi:diadenosine tetraphosphate (Ap4A) HIT family hydrolase